MLEIKKTKPTTGISTLETYTEIGLSFLDFQLFYLQTKIAKICKKLQKERGGEVKIGHHKIGMSA